MADRRRRPGSDRGRPLIDWQQAFEHYASLPFESRSYAAVAAAFNVSPRTVERHAREERWRARVRTLEEKAARQAEEQLGRRRAQQLVDAHQLIEASFVTYARQLAAGQVKVTTSDLVGLIKLRLQLQGEPGERLELVSGSGEWEALRSRILAAIAPYPEARAALADALAENDDEE